MASGEISQSEFTTFLTSVFQNLKTFSIDGSLHYVCMDLRHMKELLDIYGEIIGIKTTEAWDIYIVVSMN
jgi:hypothetical protein